MHQIQKDKFHVISPEAFSPKPLNEVQKRLKAILDYWGPNGERHYVGTLPEGEEGERRCAKVCLRYQSGDNWGDPEYRLENILRRAAAEQGFSCVETCSDSSFENARKMVLRAIALAGEQS